MSSVRISAIMFFLMMSAIARAELLVEKGYVRASVPGTDSTSAYMTLINTGDKDVVLTAVTSPAAAKVSIHMSMNHEGMMHMMGMESLKIEAHKSVLLESGGTHLMLENPPVPLAVGSKIEFVLQFADGQKKQIVLPVQSVLVDKH